MPALTEDETEDILYFARVSDRGELQQLLDETSKKYDCSAADVLSAAIDPETGNSVLHYAAANGHRDMILFICSILNPNWSSNSSPDEQSADEQRMDPQLPLANTTNRAGNTPLHWAALNGHLDAVKALFSAGSDPAIANAAGHDAVYEAESNDHKAVAEWLLSKGEGLEKGVAGETDVKEEDVTEAEDRDKAGHGEDEGEGEAKAAG